MRVKKITILKYEKKIITQQVKQITKKKTVSWIRLGDKHIISVNQTVFLNDGRFHANFLQDSDLWSLQIKYINKSDEGLYECQVSTEPKISTLVFLHVVGKDV